MTTEHQMPEGLEGLGEMLVEMDPRMAAGMVAGMLQASGCPDPDFDAVELTRLVTGQDPRLSETPLTEEQAARLARLAALPGDYRVLPGHMEPSTLDRERRFNPYMQMALREQG